MSDIPADYREQRDLRGLIARIDRDRSEGQKLQEETRKFVAEQHKLLSESRKFDRERWLAPVLAVVAAVGGVAGFASAIVTLLRLGGHG